MPEDDTKLTNEVKAMIGVTGEKVECWNAIEKEGLRRFTQALMDPDPRYWDEEFAKSTKYGEIITPPIYCAYLQKTPPGGEDPVTRAFREDPQSDGLGNVKRPGDLPPIPTDLKRILNGGNEMELYKYPSLGDAVSFQNKYADISERVTKDGSHMLIVTQETRYWNHKEELLCITRLSLIRR